MNHDYAHCMDYDKAKCPKSCFRAELTEDLKRRTDLIGIPMTWSSFRGMPGCKRKEDK